jgi:hypothetical protein
MLAADLDAIGDTVEQDDAFHRLADERWAEIVATGETVPLDTATAWLEMQSCGEHPPRPVARKSDHRTQT